MNTRDAALALIGIGCLFPGAGDLDAYWARLKGGADGIGDVPPTHWRPEDYYHPDPKAADRVYTARGGFLDAVPFNPAAFGIAPNSLEATDTAQLLGLVVAQQALADAGYGSGGRPFDRARASVILGVTGTLELVIPLGARLGHPVWRRALREAGVAEHVAEDVVRRIADSYVSWQENSFPGLLGNVVAGRIANRFDLGGTNCVVDAACASSLAAVHLAALELTSGRADLVLTGGVDTFNDVFMFTCFSKTPALSPTGDARPFAADADGTILGEGVGMVVLKRLADARRDGDRIYAVLRGMGTSSDGKGNAVYAPRAEGQGEALRSAYAAAGVTPDTVELVEAHGTGTRVGDATEATALTEVYRASGRRGSWCALGSVKSQIGHTKAAAGAAGLIKAALALHHKVLPPTIKVGQPIDVLHPGRSPFYVNTEKRPWMPSADHPRRAAVSAFGFGGSNFHCVLEEAAPDKATPDWDGDVDIVALSADSAEHLGRQLADFPDAPAWDDWRARAVHSRAAFRPESACRLLLVAQRGKTDLARLLTAARARLTREGDRPWRLPEGAFYGRGDAGALAVLFPGQGAQYPGMLRDLAGQFPALHDTLAEADTAGPPIDGRRLSDYIYPQSAFTPEGRRAHEDALRDTRIAQPALGAVSLGAWRLLEQFGVRADAAAGHSYGEWTALCAAGRLEAHDFHTLSALRGRLMAAQGSQADPGAMLAVLAPAETITEVLRAEALDLVLANKNAPRQTVLSGPTPTVERAQAAFTARQVRVHRLAVAGAFHSPLVAEAEAPLRQALEGVTLHSGRIPVVANTTAAPYPDDTVAARNLLAGQLARPVEFVAQIEHLYRSGVRTFLEVGPGARLTALVDAILAGRDHLALALDASAGARPGVFDLACCLAGLAALGHPLRLTTWENAPPSPKPTADAGKPSLVVPLCGANYVKPRPPSRPPEPPLATNGSTTATMNEPTLAPAPRPPAEVPVSPPPAVTSSTLSQALQMTRDGLAALHKMQEQTAQLHRQFLEGQESAQRTVHLLVEQQQRLLQASLGLPVAPPALPLPAPPAAVQAPPALPAPAVIAPLPSVPPTPEPTPVAVATKDRVTGVLLEVVAEKTGYPAEMLELDMALDADLGIDSIKRVEILSALQERLPEAPAVRPEHLGTLTDLRKIAAFLANGHPIPSAPAATFTPPSVPAEERVRTILLEVVAEKTGYPAEMLELDMALDADLGIDSIKRVEILSALQERLPEAPAVRPEHLGTLTDLRKIAAFLANGHGAAATPPPAPPRSGEGSQCALPPLPASGRGPGGRVEALERSTLRATSLANPGRPPIRPRPGAEIWVTAEDGPLTQAIGERLRSLGVVPRLVPVAALRDLERPASLGGLVILAPTHADDAFLRDALLGLRHAAPALRRAGGAFFVTVSRLDGAFGLHDLDRDREPLDGGLAGLAKTARHEWPEVRCKALDLGGDFTTSDEAAAVVVEECFLDGPAEVGLRRAGRQTVERIAEPLPAVTARPLNPGNVVVLTGGARGVTAEAAVALARAFRPTLVLLGRSPEPGHEPDWLIPLTTETEIKRELGIRANGDATPRLIGEQYEALAAQREIRRTLQRIEAAGGRAVYRSVDVRDPAAVAAVLDDVRRRFGPVRGLVHGAGVLADARIEDKTAEQFDRVYGTKIQGLRALLAALDPTALRVLALFSSSSARFGRAGQADYAIANEVLNKLARRLARRLPACRVVALDWGPWDGGMVTPGLKALFAREGIGLIPLESGADLLVREVCAPPGTDAEVIVLAPPPAALPEPPAAAAPPPPRPLPVAFERVLDLAEHPILESHVLDGRPVLPMALTLEWLAHAALHQNPGLTFHGCNDLRILHGVVLDGPPPTVRLCAAKATRRDGLYLAPAELRGLCPEGREVLHARAEVVLADALPPPPPPRPLPALAPYPHTPEEVYRRLLFHGPDLQAIERIDGHGAGGMAARVRTAPAPSAWLRRPLRQRWLTDPLALDAALQLLVLWGRDQQGTPGLPCFAARYRQFRRTFPAAGVRVALAVIRQTGLHALADVDFLDDAGAVVARLEGQELVLDPALDQAFRRNRLCEMQH